MQITIPVKHINDAIENKVEYDIFDNYSDDVLKAAGVTKAKIIKELKADTKFMSKVEKTLIDYLCIEDALYSTCSDTESTVITNLMKTLDKVEKELKAKADAHAQLEYEKKEEERVLALVKMLEKKGYKISKE